MKKREMVDRIAALERRVAELERRTFWAGPRPTPDVPTPEPSKLPTTWQHDSIESFTSTVKDW